MFINKIRITDIDAYQCQSIKLDKMWVQVINILLSKIIQKFHRKDINDYAKVAFIEFVHFHVKMDCDF